MHPACTLEYVWNVMSYAICLSFKQHSMAHKPTWKAPALVVAHHEDPQNTFWALHFGRVCTGNIVMRHQKVVLFSQCPPRLQVGYTLQQEMRIEIHQHQPCLHPKSGKGVIFPSIILTSDHPHTSGAWEDLFHDSWWYWWQLPGEWCSKNGKHLVSLRQRLNISYDYIPSITKSSTNN